MADQRGFSLMEAIVATVIAVIAILGLAHSFGIGQGLIQRYEIARAAFAVAQARLEALSTLPVTAPDFSLGSHPDPPAPFLLHGAAVGTQLWRVEPFDDPATPNVTDDMKRVIIVVAWGQGADQDSIRLTRLFQNR